LSGWVSSATRRTEEVASEGRPYPATVVAQERTEDLLLPRSELCAMLERHPPVVRGFLAAMGRRTVVLTLRSLETSIRVMSRWGKEGVVLTEQGGFRVKTGRFSSTWPTPDRSRR
jgi:hypothetical protein